MAFAASAPAHDEHTRRPSSMVAFTYLSDLNGANGHRSGRSAAAALYLSWTRGRWSASPNRWSRP
ncbi:MAG: hypothetical protein U0610_04400 [bacterium]